MLRLKGKLLVHGGTVGAHVTGVSGSTVTSTDVIDSTHVDNWASRALILIGRPNATVPFASFGINSFNFTTGAFSLDRSAAGIVQNDDVVVVGFKGYDNSATPTVFTDTGISNIQNGHVGMAVNSEVGNLLRVIKGKGRGALAKVISNTATSWTLDKEVVIDSTSVWIIESPNWEYFADSAETTNAIYNTITSLTLATTNYIDKALVIGGFNVDVNGIEASEDNVPIRMLWVFGDVGTGGGGGGGVTPPADVSTITVTAEYVWSSQSQSSTTQPVSLNLRVTYTTLLGWTGEGVHAYIEYPDQSFAPVLTVGVSTVGDGSLPTGIWNPTDEGKFPLDAGQEFLIEGLPVPTESVAIRVRLAAYIGESDNPLTLSTPSAVVIVNPPPVFAKGVEYAQLVSGLQLGLQYGNDAMGVYSLILKETWVPPADANYYGCVLYLIRSSDGKHYQLTGTELGNSETSTISAFPIVDEPCILYALSSDVFGNVNTYVPGITPALNIILTPPPHVGIGGVEYAPLVTNLMASLTYSRNADGIERFGFAGSLTPPQDPESRQTAQLAHRLYGGCTILIRNQADQTIQILAVLSQTDTGFVTDQWPLGDTEPTWDLYAVSFNSMNKQNTLAPGVTPSVVGLHPTVQTTGSLKLSRAHSASYDTVNFTVLSNLFLVATAGLKVNNFAAASIGIGILQSASVDDANIITLGASKITAGTINAVTITTVTINGGAITGTTLVLNTSNVTTTIGNISSGGGTAGLQVKNNLATSSFTDIFTFGMLVNDNSNGAVIQLLDTGGNGVLTLGGSSGATIGATANGLKFFVSSASVVGGKSLVGYAQIFRVNSTDYYIGLYN